MSDHILVLETEMSRRELRDLGLRVFGERQFSGHFVARNALIEKLRGTDRYLHGSTLTPATATTVMYRVAQIYFIDGRPSIASATAIETAGVPASGKTVTWGYNNGDSVQRTYRDKLVAMLHEILIPVANRNVIVTVPHGHQADLNTDESKFVIHIWSSPYNGEDHGDYDGYSPPTELWGITLPTTDPLGLPTWEEGTPIISSECDEAEPIGAFDKGNLYIYADLCHRSNTAELDIFRHILKAVAAQYNGAKLPTPADPAALREEYVKMVSKRKEAQAKEYKDRLKEIKRNLDENNRRVVDLVRDERNVLRDMLLLDSDETYDPSRFAAEYDRLMTNPLIKRVKMSRGGMTVYTNILNVTDPRSKVEHEIGEMSIYIDIQRYNVVTKNLTRKIDGLDPGMHAPHVFPDGQMCLGNMTEVIPKLIGAYQLADAAEMLLAILQTVNVEDAAGRRVDRWPRSVKQIEADKAKEAAKTTIKSDTTTTIPAARAARPVRRDILDDIEDPVGATVEEAAL